MKKVITGLVVLLVFQACTSELNEIDGVIVNHIEEDPLNEGTDGLLFSIPQGSFLVQYFTIDNYDTPLSTRIENRIRHDFNSPIKTDIKASELCAKWTGDFYFESGEYVFSIDSDRGIKILIDNEVVLSDTENREEKTYKLNQQLDGIHRLIVEYNIANGGTTDPIDNDGTSDPVDNGGTNDPVDNGGTSDPVDNGGANDPVDNGGTSDPVDNGGTNDLVDNDGTADPVVEIDNSDPTVEVGWEPVNDNVLTFYEGFENGLNLNPPWHQTGLGSITTAANPTVLGEFSVRMFLETKKYKSNIKAKAQIEYNPRNDADVPRYFSWFTSHGIRFAMYIPSDYKNDPASGLVWQLHNWSQCPVYGSISPNCAIYIANGKIRFAVRYESTGSGKKEDVKYIPYRDVFSLVPGEWHYFVIDTHWDYRLNGNGFHRFYAKVGSAPTKNNLIADYTGPTGYNATASHNYTGYPTIGIYKWDWTNQKKVDESVAAGVQQIEYFFDDFEIADTPYLSR